MHAVHAIVEVLHTLGGISECLERVEGYQPVRSWEGRIRRRRWASLQPSTEPASGRCAWWRGNRREERRNRWVRGSKRGERGGADGTASIVAKRSGSAKVAVLAVGRFGRRLTRVGLRHAAVQEQQLLSKVSRASPAVSEFSMHVGRSNRNPERCSREKCEEFSLAVTSTYYSFGLGDDHRRYRRSPSTSTMHGACLPTVAPELRVHTLLPSPCVWMRARERCECF
jgi:hypothetical protein